MVLLDWEGTMLPAGVTELLEVGVNVPDVETEGFADDGLRIGKDGMLDV